MASINLNQMHLSPPITYSESDRQNGSSHDKVPTIRDLVFDNLNSSDQQKAKYFPSSVCSPQDDLKSNEFASNVISPPDHISKSADNTNLKHVSSLKDGTSPEHSDFPIFNPNQNQKQLSHMS